MKKIISVIFFLMLISSISLAESYPQNSSKSPGSNPATNTFQATPRYIVNPVLAYFDSFIISPQQVEAGLSIKFELKLVGRDNLEVDVFYALPEEEQFFLTRLSNAGNGLYTGKYQIPEEVPPGSYIDFRAIASNAAGEIELFNGTLPGLQIVPTPSLSAILTPTEVEIGESLLFTVDATNFDATSVETFYLSNDTRFPLASLTEKNDSSVDTRVFQGEFTVPGGLPANQYNQFFAEATNANSETLTTPFNQVVTLSTDCASVNVTVLDSSEQPLPGATISIAGKTAITDVLGQASITKLTDNTEQTLFVSAPDFFPPEPKLIKLSCLTEVNESAILEPTILDCAQLDITIIDDSELTLPIAGALISVASQTDTTDIEGKATFTRLIEGPQTINVSADNFFPALPKDVVLSCDAKISEIITLRSKECATAQVTVVNDFGEGISKAKVTIASITEFTDNEGLATLVDILEGTHTVTATASGFGNSIGGDPQVKLTCDNETITPNIILDICAEVNVFVFAADGVELFPLNSATVNINGVSKITDTDGVVTFTHLNPGSHSYEVSRKGFETFTDLFSIQECRTSPNDVFPPIKVELLPSIIQ